MYIFVVQWKGVWSGKTQHQYLPISFAQRLLEGRILQLSDL